MLESTVGLSRYWRWWTECLHIRKASIVFQALEEFDTLLVFASEYLRLSSLDQDIK